jgi:hypothetical protein
MRTYLPSGILIEPNKNLPPVLYSAEECALVGISARWAGKLINDIRFTTIQLNMRK